MKYKTTTEIKDELTAALADVIAAKQELAAFKERYYPEVLRLEMIAHTLLDQEKFHRGSLDKIYQTADRYMSELNEINTKGDFLMTKKEDAMQLMADLTDELEGDNYITDSIVELATGQR